MTMPETDLVKIAERGVIDAAKALVGKAGQLDYVCFETAFDVSSARAAQELCAAVTLLESRESMTAHTHEWRKVPNAERTDICRFACGLYRCADVECGEERYA